MDATERATEIMEGKTNAAPLVDDSPIKKAEKLKQEMEAIAVRMETERKRMEEERQKIEMHEANLQLSGRASAGQVPLTQEEIDQATADKIIKNFMPKR